MTLKTARLAQGEGRLQLSRDTSETTSSMDELTSCSSSETELSASEADLFWDTAKEVRAGTPISVSCTSGF